MVREGFLQEVPCHFLGIWKDGSGSEEVAGGGGRSEECPRQKEAGGNCDALGQV